jgi:hypothetical protein
MRFRALTGFSLAAARQRREDHHEGREAAHDAILGASKAGGDQSHPLSGSSGLLRFGRLRQ